MHQGPNATLRSLKSRLDPMGHESVPAIDLLTISADEFAKIIHDFNHVFSHDLNHLSAEDQLEAIWLYMAVTFYVHHWATAVNGQLVQMQEKLNNIKALDAHIYPFVGQVLNKINQTDSRFFASFARNYHQKLLQVNANLFAYVQMLKNDQNATDALIQQIPLTINQATLSLSESKAQARENKAPSFTERRTNETLINQLQRVPEPFQPIKQTADSVYVDKETGLELDFPLKGKISIETDGIHHNTQSSKAHSLIHNLKAFAMREHGWTRVPVDANSSVEAVSAHIANLLHFAPVADFFEKNQQLIQLLNDIQTEIKDIQIALKTTELSDLERNAYINHLDFLFGRTHAIRNHLEKRHLEVLLRNHIEIPAEVNNARHYATNALAQLKSSEYTMNQIQTEYNLCVERIDAMKQKQEALNTSLKAQLEKIEKYEETETKFNNAIAKYHTSKTDGTYEKNAKAIEEAFIKNTKDLANLLNFLSGLYMKKDDTMLSILQLGNAINQEQVKLNPIVMRKEKQEKIISEQKEKIETFTLPMKQFFARYLPCELTNTILSLEQSTLNVARQSLQEKLIEAKSQAAAQEIENKRNSARQKQQRDYDNSTEELRHKKVERPAEERPAFLLSQNRRNDHRFEGGRRDHYPHGRSHARREDRDTERRSEYRQDLRSYSRRDDRFDDRRTKNDHQSMIFG